MRFSDDTPQALGLKISPGTTPPDDARKLAAEFSRRLLRETGANLPARIAVSILNQETPGVFLAEFDKGPRGRFDFLLDPQGRLLVAHFGLNGGERGLFFAHDPAISGTDIWMAFWGVEDYQKGRAVFSDAYELVSTPRDDLEIDVRDWKHVRVRSHLQLVATGDGVRAIPLMMNETLSSYDDERLKKALRLKSAHLAGGGELTAVQEDWDGTVTLFLPAPLMKGQSLEPVLEFEGEYLLDPVTGGHIYYVRGDSWYPRHGYLDRSAFHLTFRHKKGTRVACIGQRIQDGAASDGDLLTEWKMDIPVALVTFAMGDFTFYTQPVTMESGGQLPTDCYSPPSAIKCDFILAELSNSLRYFVALFGAYPYPRFGGTFHPFPFGQGFPSLLMLPQADVNDKHVYQFIAHETSHQWWGNVVAWRSYRDQWLSEGFAEYSGILFTGRRSPDKGAVKSLLQEEHDKLMRPPKTLTGIGKGRLADIGPIIAGHRLSTRESFGAYQALIYAKGALVLRMLHFLLSNPSTGDGNPFFTMMQDFEHRYTNRSASTEDFLAVANEHFVKTPIAQKYKLQNSTGFSTSGFIRPGCLPIPCATRWQSRVTAASWFRAW
jgi:hypothetical protein